ncbi:MAG TPA: type I restriction-modification enzyme R subunit C-terminal domain-containing protein, partial [Lamprocystis sp. (in: g-proteobacteria)]|nr:type I restriction-modification enzyme R subunit C-terminal domain-containing protein [Lamprocystis sp. (in: g-proteobacteria)]
IEGLRLLPKDLPEVRRHLNDLAFALSPAFWQHLDYQRIMDLHDRFAPLMRFRSRRPRSAIIQLDVTDRMAQRHWLVYGPGGEGTFAENYRLQVEAMVRRLAEESPALKRLCAGDAVSEDDLAAIESLLTGPDLFISEARLRDAYEQPTASLADFLRHILGQTRLPSREGAISEAFDAPGSRVTPNWAPPNCSSSGPCAMP